MPFGSISGRPKIYGSGRHGSDQNAFLQALYQEAIKANVHTDPDTKVTIALAVREAMVQPSSPSRRYPRHRRQNQGVVWRCLVQFESLKWTCMIVVQSEEEARAALDEINGGKTCRCGQRHRPTSQNHRWRRANGRSALPPQCACRLTAPMRARLAREHGRCFALIQVKSKTDNVQALVKEDIRENVKKAQAMSRKSRLRLKSLTSRC